MLKIRKKIIRKIAHTFVYNNYIKKNKIPEVVLLEKINNAKTWIELEEKWKKYYFELIEYVFLKYWLNFGKIILIFLLFFFINGFDNWFYTIAGSMLFFITRIFEKPAIPHFKKTEYCTVITMVLIEMPILFGIFYNKLILVFIIHFLIIVAVDILRSFIIKK